MSEKNTALIATDIHIRPEHMDLAKILLDRILVEIDTHQPKYLFILGDTFHYKNRLFASCLYLFQEFLQEATKKCQVIILVGNHDWGIPYSVHALESFRHIENLTIVDDYFKLGDNGFVSYAREKERFQEMLNKLGPCRRLFGHLDINEFKVGSGWEEVDAYNNPDDFKNYEQVFSGHLHLAQERKLSNGTEIVFIGTGYTTDFGESDQKKRFLLLDLDTSEYQSIDTGLTMHKTLKIEATDPFPPIDEEEVKKGVEYRVIVSGTREQIALIQKPKGYPARIVTNFRVSEEARIDLSVADSRQDTLKKYITHEKDRSFGGDKSGLEDEKLLKIGERILNKFM